LEHLQPSIQQSLSVTASVWFTLRAFLKLLWIDLQLVCRGFPAVYDAVRRDPVCRAATNSRTESEICHAVDLACVFYFKEVRCLQRSAAAAILLRNEGFFAEMVIGVQPCPFRAHAWVEISNRVVNDKPYTSAMYTVLERC
jgi:hypothetical protein